MRLEKVPIDMASEQKNIQGVVSSRQAVYVVVSGLLLYSYIPPIFMGINALFGWLIAIAICFLAALPVILIVIFLAFTKVPKYNMNRDYFYLIKFQKKTQYGSWRKGM
ncbi:PrgI family protein [Rummeliibacillus stabekisii]|uniref:PrgI family mobile element protein n=1 Tax=Rummeliibacillus stabekisii TaxID=241244 RepID=UPI002041885A|nr:PrgI family protein [Rummeliibacillus stabekisii]MCM3317931.1 PrgI family protein [Rummeliibacillus stabekisii]